MINICEKDKCTGCAACMNICAHNAISMTEQGICGYIYPEIDQDKCIDCGLCVKTCPANTPVKFNAPLKAFAAISKDHNDLMTSASGGASSVLVNSVLNKNGIVYGCVQRNYKHISHERIDKIEDAHLLKGSKYVQSYIGYIYRNVKEDLKTGKTVLFTGTPCQIAGLKSYLKKDYDNLILVDLVCHGVPSQKLLAEDVENLLRDYPYADKEKISVEFRRKKNSPGMFERDWGKYISYGVFLVMGRKDTSPYKKKRQTFLRDNYITAFMAETILRDNCYKCPYAQSQRCGDITIADFWGIKHAPFQTSQGISLLLPSTPKGVQIIQDNKNLFDICERPVEEAIHGNGRLNRPSVRPKERDIFLNTYPNNTSKAYNTSLKNYKEQYRIKLLHKSLNKLKEHSRFFRLFCRLPKVNGLLVRSGLLRIKLLKYLNK